MKELSKLVTVWWASSHQIVAKGELSSALRLRTASCVRYFQPVEMNAPTAQGRRIKI